MAKQSRNKTQRPVRGARRRGRRPILAAVRLVLVIGLAGVCVYAFYDYARDADRFRVSQIQVEGCVALDPRDVIRESGITTADNIWFLRTQASAERVRAMPYVRDCTVARSFPDMAVIRVRERVAVATLVVSNRAYLIDGEGVVVAALGLRDPHAGPLITSVPGLTSVEPGQRLDEPVLSALRVWHALQGSDLADAFSVSEIAARAVNDIGMYIEEVDFEIRWGRDGFAGQADRLGILWDALAGPPPCKEYLDLRFEYDLACK